MMFYKPLVSLVAALAAASSVAVAASVTPVARRNDGGYPPPDCEPISQSQCDTNSVQCCNTYTSADNPVVGLLSGVLGIALDSAAGVGVSCVGVVGGTQCLNDPVCCENVHQNGLINVGCSPINADL